MDPYAALRGVQPLSARTLTVPDREPVERIEEWAEGCFSAWCTWEKRWASAFGTSEEIARAEAAERWIARCLRRSTDGGGVWTDEEGADRAAWRETAERAAAADWWLNHRSMEPIGRGLHRLPCRYAGYAVVMAWCADEDGLHPCFAIAGGETPDEAADGAVRELRVVRHWREDRPDALWQYGCEMSAPWLYHPAPPSVPMEGDEPMPNIARRVRFREYHYAQVEAPREVTRNTLRRTKGFP